MKTRKKLITVVAIFTFAFSFSQTVPSYVPSNGLIGWWPFNNSFNELSGAHETVSNFNVQLSTDRFNQENSSAYFNQDGTCSTRLETTINGNLVSTGISFDFWVKRDGNGCDNPRVLCIGSVQCMWDNNSSGPTLGQADGTNSVGATYNSIPNNEWAMITYTNDGETAKFYQNGILIYSMQNLMHPIPSLGTGGSIGMYWFGAPLHGGFQGNIDDLAIYNRALTQQEITQLYTSSTSTQNLCTKTVQPYNVNVGDATHEGSTYVWSITPAAPNAVITGNGTNAITIDWTNVPDGSYRLQAIETSVEGCVSTAVAATINLSATPAPIAQPQTFCNNATVANLVATGTNLNWYTVLNGGTTLDTTTALTTGTYYVSQTIGTCESVRTAVAVIISPQVTPTFTPIASTCSGSNLTALPTTSNNGITGTWSPAINNNVTTTYTFTPDAGQCATTTTQTINITAPKVTSPISFVAPTTTVAALTNVTIGTQIWTSKNLDVSTYRDGTPIPQVTDPTQWENLTTGAWCYYDNNPANGEVYGKLYNWYAVAGIYDNDPNTPNKTLAPTGWHVGSDNEWNTLSAFLGGESVASGKMKVTGTEFWASPNSDATNSSGFSGLPGGYRFNQGPFNFINEFGIWWSSSETSTTDAWGRSLNYGGSGNDNAGSGSANKAFGGSVRLIKD